MEAFRETMDVYGVKDLMFSGPSFTWRGNRHGEVIKVRLDRFFASNSWLELFPLSRVMHVHPNKSDHLPILIEIRARKRRSKRKRKKRFRFEELWHHEDDCLQAVQNGWWGTNGEEPLRAVCNKIHNTREALIEWSASKFGSLKKEIEVARAQLAVGFDSSVSEQIKEMRSLLENKLSELLQREQLFWKQRAKVFWLSDGDMKTKFFHQRATNRRRKNTIKGLFDDDGNWCTDDKDLEHVVLSYF
ncbi:uncharacterized protein LOC112203116 [Rosa chinensis]|uniref:uncharacterized protein LOC112203116 n=1 Tax=Rosa chinensis TaxID=74649 RepID=UPI000D090FDC|nr:uncharacterized protein LOC112203116 [Rosa chinensis]